MIIFLICRLLKANLKHFLPFLFFSIGHISISQVILQEQGSLIVFGKVSFANFDRFFINFDRFAMHSNLRQRQGNIVEQHNLIFMILVQELIVDAQCGFHAFLVLFEAIFGVKRCKLTIQICNVFIVILILCNFLYLLFNYRVIFHQLCLILYRHLNLFLDDLYSLLLRFLMIIFLQLSKMPEEIKQEGIHFSTKMANSSNNIPHVSKKYKNI